MSGGTLPNTGAGTLMVAGIAVTTQSLALTAAGIVAVGVLLVVASVRMRWRRGKTFDEV